MIDHKGQESSKNSSSLEVNALKNAVRIFFFACFLIIFHRRHTAFFFKHLKKVVITAESA